MNVGAQEIADEFGVERKTVLKWYERRLLMPDPFPLEAGMIDGRKVWKRSEIRKWGYKTGRLSR